MVWSRRSVLRLFMAILVGEASYVFHMGRPAGKFTLLSLHYLSLCCMWHTLALMDLMMVKRLTETCCPIELI